MNNFSDYFFEKKTSMIIIAIILFIIFLTAITIGTLAVFNSLDSITKIDIISIVFTEVICTLLILNFVFLFITFLMNFSIIVDLIVTSIISVELLYSLCVCFNIIISPLSGNFLGFFLIALVSIVLSLLITSIIFAMIAIINKIRGKDIKYKPEKEKDIKKIRNYTTHITKIVNIIIITISIIAFIISLVIFIKDGNYSIMINKIKEEGLTKSFTNQAYSIYFNHIIQIIIAILTFISYITTLIVPYNSLREKVLNKFAISVSIYYIIVPILLFCITNIVALGALIIVIIGIGIFLKQTDSTIDFYFKEKDEERKLENFVRNMRYK